MTTLSGSPVRITLEWRDLGYGQDLRGTPLAPPDVGDMLRTMAGSYYLIQTRRQVRRRTPGPPKYAMQVLRLDPGCVLDAVEDCHANGGRVDTIQWHSRSRRRR